MSANATGVTELQAFLSTHPRRQYRQGVGVVPIRAIRAAAQPMRSDPDPERLEELVESIRITGIIQPLIVRPVEGFPHQFEVVAGERRLRAAQIAGLSDVPVIIHQFSDQESVAISLIENIQREELSPVDEARALRRLTDDFALTHEQVARAIGRSRATVTNLLRLLDLPSEVATMVDTRALSMGHARALLGIEDDAERVRVAQMIATRQWSVRDAEAQVRKMQRARSHSDRPPACAVVEIRKFVVSDGLRIELHQHVDGRGRIVIEFDDEQMRDGVLARLGAG